MTYRAKCCPECGRPTGDRRSAPERASIGKKDYEEAIDLRTAAHIANCIAIVIGVPCGATWDSGNDGARVPTLACVGLIVVAAFVYRRSSRTIRLWRAQQEERN